MIYSSSENVDFEPSNDRPLVLYVSDIPPINTVASEVVVYRHLKSLEKKGYDICVITVERSGLCEIMDDNWIKALIPRRRIFYPPYRPYEPLCSLRWILNDITVKKAIGSRRVHCVVSVLEGEYLSRYAERLAKKLGRPLFYFYHDRGEALVHDGNPRKISRIRKDNLNLLKSPVTRRVWTVSKELIYSEDGVTDKFRVVPPVPQKIYRRSEGWQDEWKENIVLAHIGTIYNESIETFRLLLSELQESGGKILIYSHHFESVVILKEEFPNVVDFVGFESNLEIMFENILSTATGFLVVSPMDVDAMPWSLESFPSKFVQMVQVGLPVLIFAPARTSIGRWCREHEWSLYRESADTTDVASAFRILQSPDGWKQAAKESRDLADGAFKPEEIEALVNRDVAKVRPYA